jgi:hypothetical protein
VESTTKEIIGTLLEATTPMLETRTTVSVTDARRRYQLEDLLVSRIGKMREVAAHHASDQHQRLHRFLVVSLFCDYRTSLTVLVSIRRLRTQIPTRTVASSTRMTMAASFTSRLQESSNTRLLPVVVVVVVAAEAANKTLREPCREL